MKERRRTERGTGLAAGSALLSALLLVGCSSVSDAVNPVHWYKAVAGEPETPPPADDKGSKADFPSVGGTERPTTLSSKDRAEISQGLAADRANAKYTQSSLSREGNPTRPLNSEFTSGKPASSAASSLAPQAPPVPPKPVSALPVPAKPMVDDAPPAPPPVQVAAAPPPAPAPAKVAVATPAPAPQPTPVVASPLPAPVAVSAPTPAPSPAPSQPPKPYQPQSASAGAAPPPPAPSPAPTPAAAPLAQQVAAVKSVVAPMPESLEEVYRRRLAEFSSTQAQPAPAAPPPGLAPHGLAAPVLRAAPAVYHQPTALAAAPVSDQGIHLVSPSQARKQAQARPAGGVHALDEFQEGAKSSSFDVASLGFGEGTTELSAAETARLKEVAALYKQTGGSLRVVGRSASPRLDPNPAANQEANRQLALQRADVVARALIRLGVPARKIYAGPAASDQLAGADATDIVIDY